MTVHPRISAGEVFQYFRDSSPLTWARLSALTGLSRAAATDRLRTLTSRGLIGPTYEAPSTGGRPSAQYRLMPNGGAVMSVLMSTREAKVQAFDLSGQPLSAAKHVETNPVQIVATGVALDEDAPDLKWPEYLSGRPVVIDCALGAMVISEALSRTPRPQSMLFLDVGKTTDCAMVVHGTTLGVLRTSEGAFGHTLVKGTSAQACACGITNCLQAIAGEEALIASLSSDSKDQPDAISDAVHRTDAAGVSALRQAGRDIGDTLSGSIHLLRPEVITAVYAGGAPAVTGNLVLASSRTGSPATGIALRTMDAGLAVEAVDRLLSAPPNLSETADLSVSTAQVYLPLAGAPADQQRVESIGDRQPGQHDDSRSVAATRHIESPLSQKVPTPWNTFLPTATLPAVWTGHRRTRSNATMFRPG